MQARKPSFWGDDNVLFEIVTPDGLMRPATKAVKHGLYCGGSAKMVQHTLGVQGDQFLYVGDHIYTVCFLFCCPLLSYLVPALVYLA